MDRKWLAGITVCVLVLGLTPALQIGGRAQSPTQSQPQAPSTEPHWQLASTTRPKRVTPTTQPSFARVFIAGQHEHPSCHSHLFDIYC